MSEFFMQVATILGGVVGSLIGFVVIALVIVLLVAPYVALTWRRPHTRRSTSDPLEPIDENRY